MEREWREFICMGIYGIYWEVKVGWIVRHWAVVLCSTVGTVAPCKATPNLLVLSGGPGHCFPFVHTAIVGIVNCLL